jgi:hypothetical protein
VTLEPDHLEPPRRTRRGPSPVVPWWRRIAFARIGAIAFCLAVWIAVGRACTAMFWPA